MRLLIFDKSFSSLKIQYLIFKSFNNCLVILPLAKCRGSSFFFGDPLQPTIKSKGMEYTSLLAIEINGFIALLNPEFCR